MAYTIPITITLICLAGIFLLLAKVFSKENRMIKTLFVMFTLAITVLISQIGRIIVDANASGTALTSLRAMTTTSLVITITLFSFFTMYFLVTYTRDLFYDLRDSKRRRRYG